MALVIILIINGCAPKQPVAEEVVETPSEEIPTTGEKPIDEVAEDISDTSNVDEELDTSELDDIEDILSDIENI